MNDSQTPTYRSHTTPTGDRIEYRQAEDEDGVFAVRMPIATTGEVRNQGDDPLTRDELEGMARQIEDRTIGVFLDHGGTDLGGMERYSAVEKVGEWRDPNVETRDDEDGTAELVATARMMDPESLPSGVNDLRAALGSIKEQVKRDFSVSASIGWREDESYPGGNDLMEASIVGIGADPRTTSEATGDAGLVARAAVEAGADPDVLLETVREAVESERPLGPPEDPDRFETFEECVASLAEDGDLTEAEAERICGAWEEAKDQDMTDDDTGDEAGTTDEEQDGETTEERQETPEWVSELRDLLEEIHEAVREDDDEDEEDEEDQEADEDDDEEEEDEQSTNSEDSETEQSVDEETAERIAEFETDLEKVRNGELDIEDIGAEPDEEQDADDQTDVSGEEDADWRAYT